MEIEQVEQIGSVAVRHIKCADAGRRLYSDGSVEEELYRKLTADPALMNALGENGHKNFAFAYHLSAARLNLLKWFPFEPDGSLLDVGTGCGALTGLFASKLRSVTGLELSPLRARIAATRHQQARNLEIVVGGLQDFNSEQRYTYVTAIGVLEYAATFFGGPEPYETFLKRAAGLLQDDGALILAIENKLGLKYIAGAPEDHTGLVFESLYNYPHTNRVRTFSKKELAELLYSAGFESLEWYYPFPDYKMPRFIFSDQAAPRDSDKVWYFGHAESNGNYRKEIISERLLGRVVAQAGLAEEFANSFLVVARRAGISPASSRCLKFVGASPQRKPEFRMDVSFWRQSGQTIVVKTPTSPHAEPFMHRILESEQRARKFFGDSAQFVAGTLRNGSITYPYLPHKSWEGLIAEALTRGNNDGAAGLVGEYVHFIRGLPSQREQLAEAFLREFNTPKNDITKQFRCLRAGAIDLIPANILLDGQTRYILDNEWFFDFPIPTDLVVFRGIGTLVINLQDFIQSNAAASPVALLCGYGKDRIYMPIRWLELLKDAEVSMRTLWQWSNLFGDKVMVAGGRYQLRLKSNPKVLRDITPASAKLMAKLNRRFNALNSLARRNTVSAARRVIRLSSKFGMR
jgi:2-polyprenyl-3-methyl-5-hydroxy-6-metoxy-1,4-benzoquinol methylase